MRVRIISYTEKGRDTAERIKNLLTDSGDICTSYALPGYAKKGDELLYTSAAEWAGEGFLSDDALIFCCACGIAVRAVAEHVRDKTSDPAVIVTDEGGHFVIPILSGHIGGANELAEKISDMLGATPVITTATDTNGLFAVDVFAKKNHLKITDMHMAKTVSAALVRGEKVGFVSDMHVSGKIPDCLTQGNADIGICISADDKKPFPNTLRLIPAMYAVGVGCRKGKEESEIEAFFLRTLEKNGIKPCEVRLVASIDIKKDEAGIIALCEKYGLPFVTFSAEELNMQDGDFTVSEFVREHTGVDSVCERAAVCASCGRLCIRKTAENGMTLAAAKYEEDISFE